MPNDVVALTLSPRTPGWLKVLGLEPMLLGLDLRGGVHFLYQVDLDSAVAQFLETYETDLRTQFRERNIRNDVRVVGRPSCMSRSSSRRISSAPSRSFADSTAGDQLMQIGQLTSRLIIERTTSTAAKASS